MSEPILTLRDCHAGDVPFVYNSWLKSFKLAVVNRAVGSKTYFDYHHKAVTSLLSKSRCIVACDPNHPEQIFGYIVVERAPSGLYLHWCYVKDSFRNAGVGRALEAAALVDNTAEVHYTFFTRHGDKLIRERKYRYLPFYIRISQHEADDQSRDRT